jgi:hypothetical protein
MCRVTADAREGRCGGNPKEEGYAGDRKKKDNPKEEGRGGAAGARKKKDMRAVRKKKDNPKEEGYPRSAKLLAERCRLRT